MTNNVVSNFSVGGSTPGLTTSIVSKTIRLGDIDHNI